MVSLLQRFLGLPGADGTAPRGDQADTDTVRRIVRSLEEMTPERARFVAAFAFVLARVANADQHISPEETAHMERVVVEFGGLPEAQAVLVVQIAKTQQRLAGGTENFLVTREFNAIASRDEKERLLHCLFAVSAADDAVTLAEENEVRRVATELGFSHGDFSAVRSRFNDKRTVLKDLPRQG
jgi:uncharacterized tellurite resistance protein B-like protein